MNETVQLKAIVTSVKDEVNTAKNDSQFIWTQCEFFDTDDNSLGFGPAKFTILSRDGRTKKVPSIGEEMVAYCTKLPSTKEAGKFVLMVELGRARKELELEKIFNMFEDSNSL